MDWVLPILACVVIAVGLYWFLPGLGRIAAAIRDAVDPLFDLRLMLLLLIVGGVLLLGLDQGRDVVRELADDSNIYLNGWLPAAPAIPSLIRWGAFLFACLWTGLNAWYWSDLLYRSKTLQSQPIWYAGFRQFLGIAPLLCAIIAMPLSSVHGLGDVWEAMLWFAGAVVVLLGLFNCKGICRLMRRDGAGFSEGSWAAASVNPSQDGMHGMASLPRTDKWLVIASLTLALVLLALLSVETVRTQVAWGLGPAAIAFGAIGCIIPLTSMVIWRSRRYRLPVITVGLLAFALFSLWNDNHTVRPLPGPIPVRPTVDEALATWEGQHTATDPLLLVATAGGASRAAYWTGTVLRALEDHFDGKFSAHVFAISSVSGGTLGAVGYAAWVADHPPGSERSTFQGSDERRSFVQDFFGSDYLGPAVAGLLFPDLVQRFLPYPLFEDRAASLEESWELAWSRLSVACRQDKCPSSHRFAEDFTGIWAGRLQGSGSDVKPWVPIVLSNGTYVENGKRILTAPVRVTPGVFEDSLDFYDLSLHPIRASTAVSNSARFPIISPAGTLINGQGPVGRIVDGGYFENGGLETVYDLARYIHRVRPARPIVIVEINNDDTLSAGDRARHGGSQAELPVSGPERTSRSPVLSEVTAIIGGLYGTRSARGILGAKRISDTVASGLDNTRFFRFQLGPFADSRRTTMSWALSLGTRDAMDVMFDVEKDKVGDLLKARPYSEERRAQLTRELVQVIDRNETKLNRSELILLAAFLQPPAVAKPEISQKLAPVQ